MEDRFMNYISPTLAVLLFLGYLLLWKIKSVQLMKTAGVKAEVYKSAEKPIQQYFNWLESFMSISVVLILAAHFIPQPKTLLLNPINFLDMIKFDVAGFLIGVSGLLLCLVAQITIGKSWRVGIDYSAKPGLIKSGIYSIIRNPTYTGLFILCTGVFIINPTVLMSYWILAFFIMMEFQVRCEEEYLENIYGPEYSQYITKTKRYIPFVY